MMVMSNINAQSHTAFSAAEIGAAKNAFLQYEEEQQVHLLAVMPKEEAVGILSRCKAGHVQRMIRQLELRGHSNRAHLFTRQLELHDELSQAGSGALQADSATDRKRVIRFLSMFTLIAGSGFYYMVYNDLLELPFLLG